MFVNFLDGFAFLLCISMANMYCYGGNFVALLTVIACISTGIILIVMLMLCRLPQAVEQLSFKVRKIFETIFLTCLFVLIICRIFT